MSDALRVLLVDDSPEDRAYLRRLLERAQERRFTVVDEETGADAIRRMEEEPPDCVVLDYNLPDMDGVEFIRRCRDAGGERVCAPVVMLTGSGDETVAVAALRAGAHDYLSKQRISADGLVRAVERAIEIFHLEREVEEQRRSLELRNRQLESYAAVVAHDLRNPVGLIQTSAAFLLDILPPDAPAIHRQQLGAIHRSAARGLRLINDLMDVARIETGKLEVHPGECTVPEMVDEALAPHRTAAGAAGIVLCTELSAALPPVRADRDRVVQVLDNLLANALKFTPAGGSVTVCAAPRDACVEVAVEDTGPGLAPDLRARVFDRFWQAERGDDRGLGLGLAIVKGLVEAHGGRVWADAAPGGGASFRFTLPRA
jgi:signal transduction histidine kinase